MRNATKPRRWYAVLAAATALITGAAPEPKNTPPATKPQYDDTCITCVCRANGKNGQCVTDELCTHLDTFGPFCISLLYWIDAGKPVMPGDHKDLPGAFRRCVEEPFCAVQTVRGYMDTGPALQDCDHDGTITCRDLLLTHLHSRYNCQDKPDARLDRLARCLNETTTTTEAPRPQPTEAPRPQPTAPTSQRGRSPTGGSSGHQTAPRPDTADNPSSPDGFDHGMTDNRRDHGHGVADGTPDSSRIAFNYLRGRPMHPDTWGTENTNPHGPADLPFNSHEFSNMNNRMREMQNGMRNNMNNHMHNMGNMMNEYMRNVGAVNLATPNGNVDPHPGNEDGYHGFHDS